MRCNCGYNGPADPVHPSTNKAKSYFQCPQCKSSDGIIYVTGIDSLKLAMKRPMTKEEIKKEEDPEFDSWEIIWFSTNRLHNKEKKIGFKIEQHKDQKCHSYGWININEWEYLKQWAKKVGVYEDYDFKFEEVDCYICQHIKPDENCKYYVKRIVKDCKGLTLEESYEKKINSKL